MLYTDIYQLYRYHSYVSHVTNVIFIQVFSVYVFAYWLCVLPKSYYIFIDWLIDWLIDQWRPGLLKKSIGLLLT